MVIKQREGSRGQLERYSATGTAQRPWRAEGVLARSIDSAVGPPPRRSPSARCSRRPAAPRQRRPPSSLSASPTTSVTAAPGGGAVNGQPGNGVETGAAAKPGADPALCNSATLSVTLGPSEGAAGTVYAPLRFSNRAGRSCVVQGFPGVSYVTGDRGDQVGQAAQRDGAPGGRSPCHRGRRVRDPGHGPGPRLRLDGVPADPGARPAGLPTHRHHMAVVPLTDATGCGGNPPGRQPRISSVKPGAGPG
jgi:Protein of unknown function (DUF4232)